jgi:hypothetical protein
MSTWRSRSRAGARIACLAGGLLVAGCSDHGNYQVSWKFVGDEDAAAGCGRHGVDAIRVTGASTQGDGEDVVTLCTGNDGSFTHGVPTGNWAFTIHQLDVRGRPIDVPQLDDQGQPVLDTNGYPTFVPDPTATATIAKDATVDLDPAPVLLTPRPECSDGVDNDGDGRIDLDDPDCAGASNVNTATECGPGEDC